MTESVVMEPKRRGPIYAEYRGPGPAYQLRTMVGTKDHCLTKRIGAAYSIGLPRKPEAHHSPGPAYSYDAYLTSRGRQAPPAFSLQSRPPGKGASAGGAEMELTPGPGSYDPQNLKPGTVSNERRAPAVSMGTRSRYPWKNEAPPPNTYNKATTLGPGSGTTKGAPAWSFGPRSDWGGSTYDSIRKGNPGPGSYGAIDPNKFKVKSGSYTIQGRTQEKDYNSAKHNPGPGAYDPAPVLRHKGHSGKGFTMGQRHSEYILPLINDVDCM